MTYRYEFKLPPFEHQKDALRRAWKKEAFAYFMEMGTGKTKTLLDEICMLWETGEIDCALIFAPKGVYRNWVDREIPTHVPERVLERATVLEWRTGGGSVAHQAALMSLLTPHSTRLRLLVMNVEALSSGGKALNYAERFVRSGRCLVGVDESTFIKNPDANRTKKMIALGKFAVYRRIMTGSPVTRSPLDLYSQVEFLDPNLLGFSSYYSFRARYAITKKKEFAIRDKANKDTGKKRKVTLVVGYQNIQELTEKLNRFSFRVLKKDCLDLPEKIYQSWEVDLTEEQLKIYNDLKKKASAELASGTFVSATQRITQLLRMQQVLCGHVTDEDGVVHDIPSNRISAMLGVLEEAPEKVIIWARFRRDIEKIQAALAKEYGPESVVQFHGGIAQPDRIIADQRFRTDPTCRFLVANTQTGGYGNTWVEATMHIYYSNDYDLEKRQQSEDRSHRAGQTQHVNYVDLIVPGTSDSIIIQALRKKIDISTIIMGDDYKKWLI